ncbi:probable ribonuclease ZC3H12C [Lates japonicus]
MGSLWQGGGLQDSRAYEGSPLNSRRNYSGLNQQPQHQIKWDPHYQQTHKPCYGLFTFQSHPEVHEKDRHSLWGRQAHSSPHGLSKSSLPPLPQLSLPSITSRKSHLPSVHQHQEPPALGRYQDLRERMFVNLCGIFPPDLVRMVMTRNPHVMDAQELAAAILMEKSQHGS